MLHLTSRFRYEFNTHLVAALYRSQWTSLDFSTLIQLMAVVFYVTFRFCGVCLLIAIDQNLNKTMQFCLNFFCRIRWTIESIIGKGGADERLELNFLNFCRQRQRCTLVFLTHYLEDLELIVGRW